MADAAGGESIPLLVRRHGAAVAAYLLFGLILTGPVWRDPAHLLPGQPTSDLSDHVWGFWWVAHSILAGQLPLHTTRTHYPPGGVLWFPDMIGAMASIPFQALFGLVCAFSLVALSNLLFSALAAYALGLRWTGSRAAAFLTGTIFAFSSYALSNLHNGTTEYATTGFLPLFLLAFDRYLQQGGWRLAARAVLTWMATTVAALYYGAFTGLVAVLIVGWRARGLARSDQIQLLRRAASVICCYLLVAFPWAGLVWWSLHTSNAVVTPENAPGWGFRSLPATDVLTFFAPFSYHFPDMAKLGNTGIQHVNSLGYVALGLAVYAMARAPAARRWTPIALTFGLFLLGPRLTVLGTPLSLAGYPLLLPYGLLCFPGSPLLMVHHPFRLVSWGMLFLGGLAGLGFQHLTGHLETRRKAMLAGFASAAVVAEACFLSPARFPIPVTHLTTPPVYEAIARESGDAGVIDFPPDAIHMNRLYLLYATLHGRPVPYGANLFMAAPVLQNPLMQYLLGGLSDLRLRTLGREGPLRVRIDPVDPAQLPGAAQALAQLGYGRILVHTAALQEQDRARLIPLLDRLLGAGRSSPGGILEYSLGVERQRVRSSPGTTASPGRDRLP